MITGPRSLTSKTSVMEKKGWSVSQRMGSAKLEKVFTRDWKPETRNLKPKTRSPKPETRNPKPETRNMVYA